MMRLSVRPLEQLVVDEPDAFVQTGAQQLGVVGLKLVSVREEEVGLVLDELVDGNFLDAKEHVAIAEVFVELDPRGCVLFVGDPANRDWVEPPILHRETALALQRNVPVSAARADRAAPFLL